MYPLCLIFSRNNRKRPAFFTTRILENILSLTLGNNKPFLLHVVKFETHCLQITKKEEKKTISTLYLSEYVKTFKGRQ